MSTDDLQTALAESEGKELTITSTMILDPRMGIVEALAGIGNKSSIHNFEGTPKEIWRNLTLGENMAEAGADYVGRGPIGVQNWYLHRIRLDAKEGGEFTEPVRTVLYTEDGKILAFVSDGIVKAVANIIKVFGIGPYKPAIKVEVLAIRTANKFTMLTLVPAE